MIRIAMRWILGILYMIAGYFHIAAPMPFLAITPDWVPMPLEVIYWTGIAEFAGAIALLQPFGPQLRKLAGIALAAYALCVWPANVNHMLLDLARAEAGEAGGLGMAYHLPRMIAQPLIIWLALWTSHAMDWPFAKKK